VIVNMDKPAILGEFIDNVAAVYGAFGASDAALLDVVFGKAKVTGKLPFDVPSDMPSVMAQSADVPSTWSTRCSGSASADLSSLDGRTVAHSLISGPPASVIRAGSSRSGSRSAGEMAGQQLDDIGVFM